MGLLSPMLLAMQNMAAAAEVGVPVVLVQEEKAQVLYSEQAAEAAEVLRVAVAVMAVLGVPTL